MTMMSTEQLTCPECGHEQETPVWGTINVGINPALRDRLFDSEINAFRCEGCGYHAQLDTPLLYHDPVHGFVVQFYPAHHILEDEFYGIFEPSYPVSICGLRGDAPPVAPVPWTYLFHPHMVFSMGEMVNAVSFFERLLPGLDAADSDGAAQA